MGQQTVRNTYNYKLNATPAQERELGRVLMLCRHVYNAAVGERREAWRMCGVSVTYYQQKAELPGIKEAMPEYGDVYSQVLQDVVFRVDRAFQAFFRRVQSGESSGYPRYHGRERYNSVTSPQYGNGATVDGVYSLCPRLGGSAFDSTARWTGHPRRSRSAERQMAGMPVSRALTCQSSHCPRQGKRLA
jgi:hypothetical protein